MGKKSRTKGHDFERWVAKRLRAVWPDAKRGYQARGGTGAAPDVDGTPWYIECKRMAKKVEVWKAMQQATEGSDGRAPMVVSKVDYEAPKVSFKMPLIGILTFEKGGYSWVEYDFVAGVATTWFEEWLEDQILGSLV